MYQLLFMVAIVSVVLIALNLEALSVPGILYLCLGIGGIIAGILIYKSGEASRKLDLSRRSYYLSSHPVDEKLQRVSPACLSTSLGLLYVLLGLVVITLQAIGYLISR